MWQAASETLLAATVLPHNLTGTCVSRRIRFNNLEIKDEKATCCGFRPAWAALGSFHYQQALTANKYFIAYYMH